MPKNHDEEPEDLNDDDSEEVDDDEDDDAFDALYDLMETFEGRLDSMDKGQSSFMRAMVIILGDVAISLDPDASSEGRQAAQQRIAQVVGVLQQKLGLRKK